MLAYTDTIETKEQAVTNAKLHREQDMLIRSSYGEERHGEEFRGCSVGCTYTPFAKNRHSGFHKLSESVHGIPEELTRLRDYLYEGLPNNRYRDWHVEFTEAIPVGADLSLVGYQFKLWLLKDKTYGVFQYADTQGKKAINAVAALLRRKIAGVNVRDRSWHAVESTAQSARVAAEYAAWAAEYAVEYAVEYTAEYAAQSAARAARYAEYAARDARHTAQADKLLELMRNAPIRTK